MLFSRLATWFKSTRQQPIRNRPRRRSFRPLMEALEDRLAPAATFYVTTNLDAPYQPGVNIAQVTLRQAIYEANLYYTTNHLTSPDQVGFSPAFPSGGTVTLLGPDQVDYVTVTNGGSGYIDVATGAPIIPTVTFSSPSTPYGVTAQGTALVNAAGVVYGIVVTNPGLGYTGAPSIIIEPPPAGTTATAEVGGPLGTLPGGASQITYFNGGGMGIGTIPITHGVTIDGTLFSPHVTEASNSFSLFTVESPNNTANQVTFKNFTLVGTSGTAPITISNGNGIWNEGGKLFIFDTTVETCAAGVEGAGIDNQDDGTLIVDTSNFSADDADLFVNPQPPDSNGGGIANDAGATLTLEGVDTFSGNLADGSGGGIWSAGLVNAVNSQLSFSSNQANNGGGFYLDYAPEKLVAGTSVAPWTFSSNVALNSGGGIYFDGAALALTDATFTDNSADLSGGAILSDTSLTINSSTFTGNNCTENGGAIYNIGTLTIDATASESSTFTNNTAFQNGGSIYDIGTETLLNCTFSQTDGGFSAASGGGIYFDGAGPSSITDSTFSGLDAGGDPELSGQGGGIFVNGGILALVGDVFTNNQAIDTGSLAPAGGAIYINTPTSTTIAAASNNQTLPFATINVASTAGFTSAGSLLVTTSAGVQVVAYTGLTATSFTGCSGGTGTMTTGGSVTQDTNVTIVSSLASTVVTAAETLPKGTISVASTANFATSGTLELINSAGAVQTITYTGKTATSFTGCSGGTGSIGVGYSVTSETDASTFTGNEAEVGGAIAEAGGTLTVGSPVTPISFAVTFTGNEATDAFSQATGATDVSTDDGGAIAVLGGASALVQGATFTNNTALGTGGAIYTASAGGIVTVKQSTFSGNIASNGAALANGFSATVLDSTFTANGNIGLVLGVPVTNNGGALYNLDGGTLSLINDTIVANIANGSGGGVYNSTGGQLNMVNTIVAENTTTNNTAPDVAASAATSPGTTSVAIALNNLIGNSSGFSFTSGSGNKLNVLPVLGPLQNNGGPTQTMAELTGSPTIAAGTSTVTNVATTTTGAGSLPAGAGTITVASTAGFASSGILLITTSTGVQVVTYSSITATTFKGCVGGTGNYGNNTTVSAIGLLIDQTGRPRSSSAGVDIGAYQTSVTNQPIQISGLLQVVSGNTATTTPFAVGLVNLALTSPFSPVPIGMKIIAQPTSGGSVAVSPSPVGTTLNVTANGRFSGTFTFVMEFELSPGVFSAPITMTVKVILSGTGTGGIVVQ
jgi:predicted outer membrane repeat protein